MTRTKSILSRLGDLHPILIDLSLGRIERLLEIMGRPQDRLPPVIHVAGTNGKGSVIAYLRAMLEAEGKTVHVYTSPDLVRFHERIRLAGELVSSRRLNKALEECEAANGGRPITYFEITTAAALHLFSQVPADYLLLEVGLGGRYDTTNVVDHPLGTIITPVSIDHVEFLGREIGKIAGEKAGILKRGSPAVIGRQEDEALEVIEREAAKLDVNPFIMGQQFEGGEQNGRLVYQDENGLLDLPLPKLAGPFQAGNAAIAVAAARHFGLPLSEASIAKGLTSATWPARMMPLTEGKLRDLLPPGHELWLDGGHNEAGGKAAADAIAQMNARRPRPLVLILGTFANKDTSGFLAHFKGMAAEILAVPIRGSRQAKPPREIAELARSLGFGARPMRSVKSALKEAAKIENACVLICGSLHLAGNVLRQNGTKLT